MDDLIPYIEILFNLLIAYGALVVGAALLTLIAAPLVMLWIWRLHRRINSDLEIIRRR